MRDVFRALADRCRTASDRAAIVHIRGGGAVEAVSTLELCTRVLALQTVLDRLPVAGIVPIFQHRSADCVALMLAAVASGRTFSCLNTRLKPQQLSQILESAAATSLFCDEPGRRLLARGSQPDILDRIVVVPAAAGGGAPHEVSQGIEALGQQVDDSRAACCLFTSGSTNAPKGVLVSGADLAKRSEAEAVAFGIGPSDRILNVLPFAFDVGLNQLMTALLTGATLVLLDSWMPADLLKAVERQGITGISGVPAVWRDLRASGLGFDGGGRHRTLRYVTVSGGSLTSPELAQLRELLPGVGIFKTYGQTESFRSTILRPEEMDAKPASVGRPFAGVHVRIVDDEGRLCPTGEVGEVVHSGLGVMMGYLHHTDDAAKRRPNPFGADGGDSDFAIWTGDAGYLDEDGYLYLKGRRDGMLKVSGNRFYPDEVVAAITSLPGIADVDVLGVEPDTVETRVAAFVVATAGQTPADIKRALESRVASYMVPTLIVLLPSLPRLSNGKTDRVRLRAMAVEELTAK